MADKNDFTDMQEAYDLIGVEDDEDEQEPGEGKEPAHCEVTVVGLPA